MINIDQCYTILELTTNATLTELKKNYRRLVLKYHPDRNNNDDTHFKLIQESYETLSKHIQPKLIPSATIYPGAFVTIQPNESYTQSTGWTFTFSG